MAKFYSKELVYKHKECRHTKHYKVQRLRKGKGVGTVQGQQATKNPIPPPPKQLIIQIATYFNISNGLIIII
jgi:hypothetical protein